ncbi:hypothetical protein PPL_09789 [Heterostelium album PN500]|uniref:Uncharacterized protein n=1 Tax=Heterostelium pallidum (strain ATCC 26659 / Pp 5 / PN500) TaxID=670386 RepID=D3BP26_HETP5|nr:hypothetical protein PPL_09789 [Heterostelium album PN500]EFA77036.1 hypothetical protein PPL_09789 [Heterostelium album PN500]|eukprot:XP_020429166.1 hypothetical protein PPL_09789 [Heterostelium album PN500]
MSQTDEQQKEQSTPTAIGVVTAAVESQPAEPQDPVTLGESVNPTTNDNLKETKVLNWMKEMLNKEIKRIKDQGAKCIPFEVKNTGIVKEDGLVINRLEVKTTFNFDQVIEILISESTECPHKKGYHFINVLLFTRKPVPYIIPYIYLKTEENKLTDWVFMNDLLGRSQHKINQFENV